MKLRVLEKSGGLGDLYSVGAIHESVGEILKRIHDSTSAVDLMIRFMTGTTAAVSRSAADIMELRSLSVSGGQVAALDAATGPGLAIVTGVPSGRAWLWSKSTGGSATDCFSPQSNMSGRVFVDHLVGDKSLPTAAIPTNDAPQIAYLQAADTSLRVTIPGVTGSGASLAGGTVSATETSGTMQTSGTMTLKLGGSNVSTLEISAAATSVSEIQSWLQGQSGLSGVTVTGESTHLALAGFPSDGYQINWDSNDHDMTGFSAGSGGTVLVDSILTSSALVAAFAIGAKDFGE